MRLLSARRISKRFGATQALEDVSVEAFGGEILALCGENGAGKSTLVKIITGQIPPDTGEIIVADRVVSVSNPRDAQALGIAFVSQELSLVPDLPVIDNIWLGAAEVPFFYRTESLRKRAAAVIAQLGFEEQFLDKYVQELTMAERQLVEIARCLCRDARILILDEPSATLPDTDIKRLFDALRRLREAGCAVIYITHRLGEVFEICDRVVVFRNGQLVGDLPTSAMDRHSLIEIMIGQHLADIYPAPRTVGPEVAVPALEVDSVTIQGIPLNTAMRVPAGLVTGIAGQIGSGAADLIRAIAGLVPNTAGRMRIRGVPVDFGSRSKMLAAGVLFISEDRAGEGVFLDQSLRDNLIASHLAEFSRGGLLDNRRIAASTTKIATRVGVDRTRLSQLAHVLSGGNQQKLVFGRALGDTSETSYVNQTPGVLVMNEPSRGVDVGARSELYRLIMEFCDRGYGVLMHTTDLEELIGLSDHVLTMYRGQIVAHYNRADISAARILGDITHGPITPC